MLETSHTTDEQLQQKAFAVAHHYLQSVKGWTPEEYCLEAVRVEGDVETPIVVVNVIYLADLNSQQCGGGQSLQLAVDVRQRNIVREFAYQ